jgi:hypothetical protein
MSSGHQDTASHQGLASQRALDHQHGLRGVRRNGASDVAEFSALGSSPSARPQDNEIASLRGGRLQNGGWDGAPNRMGDKRHPRLASQLCGFT